MAHGKLRTEKNCLNCNAGINGRFCSVCGQENIDPTETFWKIISHFIYDLFHYDGKILSTLKKLIFKPGLLTHEYVRGRRASYLHPIRLYIFISAVFFIIFLSLIADKEFPLNKAAQVTSAQNGSLEHAVEQLKDSLGQTSDPVKRKSIQNHITGLNEVSEFISQSKNSIDSSAGKNTGSPDNLRFMLFNEQLPKSLKEYKAEQLKLPLEKRDSWLNRSVKYKFLGIYEKYKYDNKGFQDALIEKFLHSLPTMMFVSLPVVALLFSLLYIRHRKKFSYVQHGVFSIHLYSAIFVFILCVYALNVINSYINRNSIDVIKGICVFLIYVYIYKAMRNFYEQKRFKTLVKFLLFIFSYSIILSLLMVIFLLTSLIRV